MKKSIIATVFALISSLLPLQAKAASFSEIYVFGDSLSDTGNFFEATGQPPSPPYFKGRLSNGPVWTEYLATEIGLTPNPNNNFAFFGATTGNTNVQVPGLPGLQQQINGFTQATRVADPEALYIVWAGSNDYTLGNITDPSIPVNNILTAVNSLADVGAKNIMVVNLGDLGETPATNQDPVVSTFLNQLTAGHNSLLAQSLNQSKNPELNLIPLDVNSFFKAALNNPESFGLTNVTDACLDLETGRICNNPDEYLFWDSVHPTTFAHEGIAQLAAQELDSRTTQVREPVATFALLTFGILGVATLKKGG
ncbi:MAG: SGNH/GDSL hydrolase family protein [Gomphosphaeria aponina SAG 52.96 = DSM 107014]|uniref:SGNH/GDSL hydrolase family protein n=1 Tax=Gomphosphaeria aponina SAG 52.96 = DSM 107014 TaxID=1521640 RepID=A0A941GRL9_9CHRO|nr:SGNH/GDSL hydrolase family protein [Gomphosphaeria aponina SAG 52.96 = DSM 107014]